MVDTNDDHLRRGARVEVRSGPERRRRWRCEEKGRIVAEAIAPGAVIADVARRHDLAPQHLSNWIRAAKDGRFALPAESMPAAFVPVIAGPPGAGTKEKTKPQTSERAAIEITMGRIRVAVRTGADAKTLEAVLCALRRAAS